MRADIATFVTVLLYIVCRQWWRCLERGESRHCKVCHSAVIYCVQAVVEMPGTW